MSHTPEPWEIKTIGNAPAICIVSNGSTMSLGGIVADCDPTTGKVPVEECEANAARIVACVNGCAGLNPAALHGLVKAIKAHLMTACPGLADAPLLEALALAEQQP